MVSLASSLLFDSYTKNVVSKYFERYGKLPDWLGEIGEVKRLVKEKSSDFKVERDGVTIQEFLTKFFRGLMAATE